MLTIRERTNIRIQDPTGSYNCMCAVYIPCHTCKNSCTGFVRSTLCASSVECMHNISRFVSIATFPLSPGCWQYGEIFFPRYSILDLQTVYKAESHKQMSYPLTFLYEILRPVIYVSETELDSEVPKGYINFCLSLTTKYIYFYIYQLVNFLSLNT